MLSLILLVFAFVLALKPAPLQRLVARHTHPTSAPHSFSSSVL
jgi:hypothetical protein